MLKLLRKYQKAIFGVVAFFVIASFSFFGTYGTLRDESHKEEDRVIGKMRDGSPLSSLELSHIKKVIDTDVQDLSNGDGSCNLLNDGFFRKDIMESGLGTLIFEAYQEEIGKEFEPKVAKFKEFKTYVHPNPLISFEGVVARFAPSYYQDLMKFRSAKGSLESFEALQKLYLDQGIFSSEMLRRMMLYMEYQYANAGMQDPYLRSVDLSLFYAKSASDWFGDLFLSKVAELICNGALFAKEKGYKVSVEEARSFLQQLGAKQLKEIEPNKKLTDGEWNRFYKQQFLRLGMSEEDAVAVWQKILLFRKMLDEVGNSIFVDSLLYKKFAEVGSKGATVELFQLPRAMRIQNDEDMAKWDLYLDAVLGTTYLESSASVLRAEEICKRAGALVEKRFLVRVAHVNKEELAKEIGIRKTWDWQLEEANWLLLQKTFPELMKCKSPDREERFSYLQSLEKGIYEKIDRFARKKIVEESADLIREKLIKAEMEKKLLSIPYEGESEILPGVTNREALLALLESSVMVGEGKEEKLISYSENGNDFYRIEILDKSPSWEVLTFEEANQRGVLQTLLKGKKRELQKDRFYLFMESMRQKAMQGEEVVGAPTDLSSLQDTLQPKASLDKQFCLRKEEMKVTRKMDHPLFDETLFSTKEGEWSFLVCKEEGPLFYRVIDTFVDTSDIRKKMEEGRGLLGREAKQEVIKTLLKEMQDGS